MNKSVDIQKTLCLAVENVFAIFAWYILVKVIGRNKCGINDQKTIVTPK